MRTVQFLAKGGWVMVPITLLSILTVYAFVERVITLYRKRNPQQSWLDNIYAQILAGDLQGVAMLCEEKNRPVAKVLQVGITSLVQTPTSLAEALEAAGQHEVHKLEKNLALLGTIASTAPMLGFLGTVLGMIQAFMAMAQATQAQMSPQLLSGGIYEAMITTAAGLIVGIMADLAYKLILVRVQTATHHIEQASRRFMELSIQRIPVAAKP
ncbi:MAG: MotA/TolQ/ExbB proton channel family protein [Bacteroidota bacterium]